MFLVVGELFVIFLCPRYVSLSKDKKGIKKTTHTNMEAQYIFKSHIFKKCKKGEHLTTLNFCLSIKFCLLHLGETGCLHHCTVVLDNNISFWFYHTMQAKKVMMGGEAPANTILVISVNYTKLLKGFKRLQATSEDFGR